MIDFFKGLYRKLRTAVLGNPYQKEYSELINIFRTAAPLGREEIDRIHAILQHIVPDRSALDSRFALVRAAMRSKTGTVGDIRARYRTFIADEYTRLQRPRINRNRDVSYCVNGAVVYGDVGSDDEPIYFNRDNVAALNSLPLRAKRCDLGCVVSDCQACIEARLRREIAATMQAEQEQARSEQVKRRHVAADRGVVSDLNVKLGCPLIIARSLADEAFDIEELESDEREEFLRWRANNQRLSEKMDKRFLREDARVAFPDTQNSAILRVQAPNDVLTSQHLNNPFARDRSPFAVSDGNVLGANKTADGEPSPESPQPQNAIEGTCSIEDSPRKGEDVQAGGPQQLAPVLANPFAVGSGWLGPSPGGKAGVSGREAAEPPSGPVRNTTNPFAEAFDEKSATCRVEEGVNDQAVDGVDDAKVEENKGNVANDKVWNGAELVADTNDTNNFVNNKADGEAHGGPAFIENASGTAAEKRKVDGGAVGSPLPKNPVFSFGDPFKNTGAAEDTAQGEEAPNRPLSAAQEPANLFGNTSNPFAALSGSGPAQAVFNPFTPAENGRSLANPFGSTLNPFASKSTGPPSSRALGTSPPNPFAQGAPQPNPFAQAHIASPLGIFNPGAQASGPADANAQFSAAGIAAPLGASLPQQAFGTEQFNPFLNSNFSQTNIFQNRSADNDGGGNVFSNNDDGEVKGRRAKRKR